MKIALVLLAPDIGGVSRHVLDLADGLRERGHGVQLYCRQDAEAVHQAALARGLHWRPLRPAARIGADVWHVHLHNTLDTRTLPLMAARRTLTRGKVIITEHLPRQYRTDFVVPANLPVLGPTTWRNRPKPGARYAKTAMKKAQFALANRVIAVSDHSKEFLALRYGVDSPKVVRVFNGVTVPASPPAPPKGDANMRVVSIGDLHWRKGFDVLLDACGLAEQNWSLTIVGEGVAAEDLRRHAAALPGARSIRFDGYRSDGDQVPLEGDVVCVPSRGESFSYVVLEAMAAARPVVASNVDGARDAIVDDEHGLLVAAESPDSLSRALDSLALDPERRRRLGRAAHARARSEFTIDHMVEATLAVYASVPEG